MIVEVLSGLLINSFSSYISDQKIKMDNHILRKRIESTVKNFQENFQATELDSQAFQKVLQSQGLVESIFQKVFVNHKATGEPMEKFIIDISENAIENVNTYYRSVDRSPIKEPQDFHLYFQELIKLLLEIRSEVLSLKDSAMLSIVTTRVDESDAQIKQELSSVREKIEDLKEDNIFAEGQLGNIESLIDQYQIEEAKEYISEMLESQNILSKSQREALYYQRARILILTSEFEKLYKVRRKIENINTFSKYIYEIDYHISCNKLNDELFEEAIKNLEKIGYSQADISLKRFNYKIFQKKFDDVYNELFDEQELRTQFKNHHEGYYYLGLIEANRNNIKNAERHLVRAYELKNKSIYKFLSVYFRSYIVRDNFFTQNSSEYQLLKDIKHSIGQMENMLYVTNYVNEDLRERYWVMYVNLSLLIDPKSAQQKLEDISPNMIRKNIFNQLKAEILLRNGEYSMAKYILEEFWEETLTHIFNLFNALYLKKEYEEIVNRYKQLENQEILRNPIIQLLYFKSVIKLKGVDSVTENLYNLIAMNSEEITLFPEILKISLEYSLEDLFELVKEKILINQYKLGGIFLLEIGRILIDKNEVELARNLLENQALESEELLEIYISTFKQNEKRSEQFLLRNKLTVFFGKGHRSKILLENMILVSYELSDYKANYFQVLSEYKKLIGLNLFYSRFFILGKLHTDLIAPYEEEMKILIEGDIPEDLQLVARLKNAQGDLEKSEEISIKALYLMRENINIDVMQNHVNFYFSKMTHGNERKELVKPQINAVVVLKSQDQLRNVAIHGDSSLKFKSGEMIFNCENYKHNDYLSLMLVSLGEVGKEIEIEDSKYEIKEILHLGVYLFRYCLHHVEKSSKFKGFMKVISISNVDDFKGELIETLQKQKLIVEDQINLYNFGENHVGIPVSFISGKDLKRYTEVLLGLFNTVDQSIYSGRPHFVRNEKYVLSLSTIVLLNHLGILNKLEKISNKIIVIEDIEHKVRRIISELSGVKENKVGVLRLTEDNQILSNMHSQEILIEQRKFWLNILEFILKVNRETHYVESNELYDILLDTVFDEEVKAIELCNKKNYCYVSDDLFLSNLGTALYSTLNTNNMIGLILLENLIHDKERQSLFLKLKEHKYEFIL